MNTSRIEELLEKLLNEHQQLNTMLEDKLNAILETQDKLCVGIEVHADTSIVELLLEEVVAKLDELEPQGCESTNTSTIEELLETMVEKQDDIIKSTEDLEHCLSGIRSELNGGDDFAFGKSVLDALNRVNSAVTHTQQAVERHPNI